ncbi:LLM class flavin-dependent oxidoreductase [Allokutzneria sp. A3M-2-11 16]|uniref:LLM class flavin-dependent oxidoreductase n=1 Tax=Allokutzneria sp. A3M-2-11 16 TaxID=2962043 RepID=UPI0020B6CEFE|nr:LLM class flavin-dependent oxidoreductase [Allokutzneria sp. A3M-2-11 16]MCP3804858.1 LLM class flavin-dependent oxidoreductase [Allokutzneria sp. A3M-2-11 16]
MSVEVGLAWGTSGSVEAGRTLLGAARAAGLDSFWTLDHLISAFPRALWDTEFTFQAAQSPTPDDCLDFATVLGHLAGGAGPVRLGVGVTDPHRRHPALLAQTFLTLAQLTERAPVLGIGAGALENLQPYGIAHDRPVARVEEALKLIRMCLEARGPLDFQGRFFTLDKALMDLRAPEGRTPRIWLGANGPRMLELTGRHADGWYPWEPMTPEEYARRLAVVRAAATAAGRDPDGITPALGLSIVVGRTDEAVRKLLCSTPIRYLALHSSAAAWRAHGAAHPFGEDYRGLPKLLPHRLGRDEVTRAIKAVPDHVVATQVVAGTPRTVLARIAEFVDAGLRHVVLIPASALVSVQDAEFAVETVAWLAEQLHSNPRRTGT